MVEPANTRVAASNSFGAMILSAIIPGLGQLYLGQFPKAILLFTIFASAIGIFYLNSLPVTGWDDLMRFKPAMQENTSADEIENSEAQEPYSLHLWTFDDGEKLMYRPSWKLKISAFVQGILCWLYAVGDGWRGRRRNRP
ncbi:MAG: hypothetical protein OXD49_04165 [Candidatus Poribacteria bacterium]|nr:hypothetical protein [Candidatus Poribacteria bacterium]